MSKLFSFFSPVASLILAWLSFIFLLFFPPLWVLWPLLVICLAIINYRGIRYVLGHHGKARLWHHRFNICECILVLGLVIKLGVLYG